MSAWRGWRLPFFLSLVSIIQTWWLGTTILTHSDSEHTTQPDRLTKSNTSFHCEDLSIAAVIGWTIPRGSTRIERYPETWNLRQYIASFFYTIQTPICYVGCLMIANTWTYISIYILLSWKTKICLYFSASMCEHLWPSPLHLVNCAKCSHNPSKDVDDWSSNVFF